MTSSSRPSPCDLLRLTADKREFLPELERLYRAFALIEGHTTPISQFMDFVEEHLTDESMLVALALVNGSAVGYGLTFDVVYHPFIPTWERAGYITHLFVEENRQGQGIGQALFDYSISWLAERGLPTVMLNVHAHNVMGERFWRKQGFEPYLLRMKRAVRQLDEI